MKLSSLIVLASGALGAPAPAVQNKAPVVIQGKDFRNWIGVWSGRSTLGLHYRSEFRKIFAKITFIVRFEILERPNILPTTTSYAYQCSSQGLLKNHFIAFSRSNLGKV